MALATDLLLLERQRCACGDGELPLDQIEAGDRLGHRVLDLEARVHLHEAEGAVAGDDELDGAGIDVADRASGAHRGSGHRGTGGRIDERRRGFLDDLLVAALHRALALEQVHAAAVLVAEDLDLDVARPFEEPLEQQASVAEGALGLGAGRGQRIGNLFRGPHDAHALAAAARDGLDQQREADARASAVRRATDCSSPV